MLRSFSLEQMAERGRRVRAILSKRSSFFYFCLSLIVLLGLCTKLYRIDYPTDFYFDEVYHGFTATRYLNGDPGAYDPWAKPPPGRAFEWTHPPLAKLMMTGSMLLLGENSVGWRMGSVVTGSIAIVVTCFIAITLFGSESIALLAAFFLTIEGLFFAQSRIAMNDSYFVCFMLLAVLVYVLGRRKDFPARYLLGTGTFLGLALATKWTTLYMMLILGCDLLYYTYTQRIKKRRKVSAKDFLVAVVSFAVLPVGLYVASYAHYFLTGNDWSKFIVLQQQMWWYHTGLKATHGYQSVPWQWVLNLRPVWYYVDYTTANKIRNIYNLGNGVILWSGFISVLYLMFVHKKWTWPKGFVLFCYFMLWLPWSFSPRIMLFYHYTPALPFLCILLSFTLMKMLTDNSKSQRNLAKAVIAAAVLWFAVFYPHQIGLPVNPEWANRVYYLIPSWK